MTISTDVEQHAGPTHIKPARTLETTNVYSAKWKHREREREEATAQAFENCESDSQDLWKRLVVPFMGEERDNAS